MAYTKQKEILIFVGLVVALVLVIALYLYLDDLDNQGLYGGLEKYEYCELDSDCVLVIDPYVECYSGWPSLSYHTIGRW